jgi:hypothetical protein
VIALQMRGILEKELGDAARNLGAPFRIAISDELVQSGNQRGGDRH